MTPRLLRWLTIHPFSQRLLEVAGLTHGLEVAIRVVVPGVFVVNFGGHAGANLVVRDLAQVFVSR